METPLPVPPPDQADPVAEFEAEFLAGLESAAGGFRAGSRRHAYGDRSVPLARADW